MKNDIDLNLYIEHYGHLDDPKVLDDAINELKALNIQVEQHEREPAIMHSALELITLDNIAITYALIQHMIFSGTYDIFCAAVSKVISAVQNTKTFKGIVPFTIKIREISPDIDIRLDVKIKGDLSNDHKDIAIKKSFIAAEQLAETSKEIKKSNLPKHPTMITFIYNEQKKSFDVVDNEYIKKHLINKE